MAIEEKDITGYAELAEKIKSRVDEALKTIPYVHDDDENEEIEDEEEETKDEEEEVEDEEEEIMDEEEEI